MGKGKKESFTSLVKNEIASREFDTHQIRAILASFAKMNGRFSLFNGQSSLVFHTENPKIAKFIYLCLKKRYGVTPRFAYLREMRFQKVTTYHVIVEEKVEEILQDLEMLEFEGNTKSFVRNEESLRGFLCGAFLASGSVNAPESSNYHLEISTTDAAFAKYLLHVMERVKTTKFTPKSVQRRKHTVVYLKKSDQISYFLVIIGASETCLQFENVRVDRDFLNNDNRLQICMNANVSRVIQAGEKQKEDILCIQEKLGIENIPQKKMRLLCALRLKEEEASMQELANFLSEEIGSPVSKSCVMHLFKSIHQLAERLRGKAV